MSGGNPSLYPQVHPDGLDPAAIERPLYAAVIRPHRSLSRVGFRAVMAGIGLVSLSVSLCAWRMGFWPVAGFFGLDVLGLYLALKVSFRRGRSFEEVMISHIEILLARVSHSGERREWRFNPLWTRLVSVDDEEFGLQRLTLISRRQAVTVARDAAPEERARVGDGLSRALAEIKRGR